MQTVYEGQCEITDERKRMIYSSTWDSIILRCPLWELNPSWDRLHQDRKKGEKVYFWKEPQRRPYTITNFPSSQNCHSILFWKNGRIASG